MNQPRRAGRRIGFIAAASLLLVISSSVSAQDSDLGVMKTGPTVISPGSNVTYSVSVSNTSESGTSGPVTLTDVLPAGMTFVAIDSPGWDCMTPAVGATGTITCTFDGSVEFGIPAQFEFTFQLDSNAVPGNTVQNTVTISAQGDTNDANDASSWESTIVEPPPPALVAGDVLISEFRLSGPNGANDDYIELYCNRAEPCDISGFAIQAYDPSLPGDFSITIPGQTIIPARQFLLIGDEAGDGPFGNGYSLSTYAFIDLVVPSTEIPDFFKDNQGIRLLDGEGAKMDSVGFIGGGNSENYIEGTGLQPSGGIMPARPADQYAYVRKRTMATNGRPQDTNNNADDFVLVSVRPENAHPGISTLPVLGAPGPKSLTGPQTYSNSLFTNDLLDPGVSKDAPPNRVRVGTGNSGTVSIRRSITNNTDQFFDTIVFRVIEIPTVNSPITLPDQAIFHLKTSTDEGPFTNSVARSGYLFGTTLEFDDICGCEPAHPHGGGLNSSVAIYRVFVEPGETVDFQLLLDVERAGNYRFWVYVEARLADEEEIELKDIASSTTGPRMRSNPKARPRMLLHGKNSARGLTSKQKQRMPVLTPVKAPFAGPAIPTRPETKLGTPRVIILNRYKAEDEKKPRRKTRSRRKSSAALKKKAEERFAAEKPQN